MYPGKPEEELYDLRSDPHEIHNISNNPAYKNVHEEMQTVLSRWRERINDPQITEAFRRGGWPATYPTRSLEEWEKILNSWEAHLFESKPHPRKFIQSMTTLHKDD